MASGVGYETLPPTAIERGILRAGPFCAAHGGWERAAHEVLSDWRYQAPESVEDVYAAGAAALRSEHTYLVLREASGEKRPWAASLGLGSHSIALGQFRTEADAVVAGTATWARGVEERIAEVTRMRGGDLGWGKPLEPRLERPIVLRPNRGENGWDCLERSNRECAARKKHVKHVVADALVVHGSGPVTVLQSGESRVFDDQDQT